MRRPDVNNKGRDLLLALLTGVLLFGFALAIPQGNIREEAAEAYINEVPEDDEYAFLFD